MKFSEKLQKLRKDNSLSQEQLADMLEVSRQSVSKWESGQTYPEMDKLLSMCKIFKCSLDDLTNDEISINAINNKSKGQIGNLIDSFLEFIGRTISMFRNVGGKTGIKIVIEFLLFAIILLIFKIPVNYIMDLGNDMFLNLSTDIYRVLSPIWTFLINIIFFASYVISLVYIFKSVFLDKYENVKKVVKTNGTTSEEIQEKEVIEKETAPGKKEHSYAFFSIVGKIILFFVKLFVFFVGIPLVFSFVALFVALIISIVILFKGVVFIGIILCILACIGINYVLLETFISFIFSKKTLYKKLLYVFLISLAVLGIGIGITAIEISSVKYIDEAPVAATTSVRREITMNDSLIINPSLYSESTTYVVDNLVTDKVIFEFSYYNAYMNPDIYQNGTYAYYTMSRTFNYYDTIRLILDDLENKELHNYEDLYDVKVKIISSEENINKLKNNISNTGSRYGAYSEIINKKEDEIDSLNRKYDKLEKEYNDLEEKYNSCDDKLENYKERIKELVNN